MVYCSLCMNNNRTNKTISYFNYPKESNRRQEWLKVVGREDLLSKLDDDKTRQQYRICEDHFEKSCIKFSKNRKIKYLFSNAFPTLNLPTSSGANCSSSQCRNVPIQENQNLLLIPTMDVSSSSNTPLSNIVMPGDETARPAKTIPDEQSSFISLDQTARSIKTEPDEQLCESGSEQTALHFATDHPRKRKLSLHVVDDSDEISMDNSDLSTDEAIVEVKHMIDVTEDPLERLAATNTSNINSNNSQPNIGSIQSSNDDRVNNRKRLRENPMELISNSLQNLDNSVSNLVNMAQQSMDRHSEDEYHIFALSVASQLRQLPAHLAASIQSKIQNILSEARITSVLRNTMETVTVCVKSENVCD